MKIISFTNQKGGVAKTTSTINTGAALAIAGKRVLLVDFDPQGSLTTATGFRDLAELPTVYEVIKGSADISSAILHKEDAVQPYDVLPADIRMSGAEIELIGTPGRDNLLKEALDPIRDQYDFILIDCGPSLSILSLMILTAADGVIIPVASQYMALDGMSQLMNTIKMVQKRLNKNLRLCGVIVTLYNSRRNLDKESLKAIRERFPDETFRTIVKDNARTGEAPTFGKDIFAYDPKCTGAEAYMDIAAELMERSKDNGK